MKDLDDDSVIMKTARMIHVDDEYITGNNTHYIVERVEGNTAWARSLGDIDLSEPPDVLGGVFRSGMLSEPVQAGNTDLTFAVYHSHGAEAYVPSDGTESIDEGGGILNVGESFARALEDNGLEVKHSTETHVPHDAGAYNRSRRTVEEMMRNNADVFFDIHRDAVPAEEYLAAVDSEELVQIQFVVGRQNQNVEVNRQFAESLKNATDQLHPGLIKGIFMARGSYNQDITPLALLLEVGTHENTREGAEESVALFAEAVNYYFAGPEAERARGAVGGTALRTILWVILIALLAAGAYLIISTGSIEEARAKISHFFKKEFAEFKGRRRGDSGSNE
jgi:stage II sporulation protein P